MSEQVEDWGFSSPVTRREAVTMGLVLAAGGAVSAGPARPTTDATLRQATPVARAPGDQAAAIISTLHSDIFAAIGTYLAPDQPLPTPET